MKIAHNNEDPVKSLFSHIANPANIKAKNKDDIFITTGVDTLLSSADNKSLKKSITF